MCHPAGPARRDSAARPAQACVAPKPGRPSARSGSTCGPAWRTGRTGGLQPSLHSSKTSIEVGASWLLLPRGASVLCRGWQPCTLCGRWLCFQLLPEAGLTQLLLCRVRPGRLSWAPKPHRPACAAPADPQKHASTGQQPAAVTARDALGHARVVPTTSPHWQACSRRHVSATRQRVAGPVGHTPAWCEPEAVSFAWAALARRTAWRRPTAAQAMVGSSTGWRTLLTIDSGHDWTPPTWTAAQQRGRDSPTCCIADLRTGAAGTWAAARQPRRAHPASAAALPCMQMCLPCCLRRACREGPPCACVTGALQAQAQEGQAAKGRTLLGART